MFEDQGGNPVGSAPIAHQPDEARDAADAVVARSKPLELDSGIEILALHPDH